MKRQLRQIGAYLMAQAYDRVMARSETLALANWRAELLQQAQGDILEIGAGTGLNLPFYPAGVQPILSEPDRQMRHKLAQKLRYLAARPQPQLTDWPADNIDLPDSCLDSIVSTLVLCSVADQQSCLAELYRLLRPGGALLFIEHVVATEPQTRRWQQRLNPVWRRCCGNCQLTRDTGTVLQQAGFQLENYREAALPGAPAIVRRTIRGLARKPHEG